MTTLYNVPAGIVLVDPACWGSNPILIPVDRPTLLVVAAADCDGGGGIVWSWAPGDFNGDGAANVLDYLDFLERFSLGAADLDRDGVTGVADFVAFLAWYGGQR